MAWTLSCCASLPGLRNRFWQCPQTCTFAPVIAGVKPTALDGPSDALLEPSPSSKQRCIETQIFSGATAVVLSGLRFPRGSCGSGNDRLRDCRIGSDFFGLYRGWAVG